MRMAIHAFEFSFPARFQRGRGVKMIRTVICDDEKAARNMIKYYVESEHLPIEIVGMAEDGCDAWNVIQKERPDLVFMDIHMPFLSGFEVMQRLPDTKFIVITAYDCFEYAQKALRMGVCDIIAKPIEFDQLRDAITRAVGWNFTPNEQVNKMLEYIHKNFREKIELEDLMELTFCSKVHVSRVFKQYMGMTVVSYINKVRIDNARNLIDGENLSVKEAAEQSGYQNLNNFYKYFKLNTGMTPALYIRNKGEKGREC